jgi:hypothetical protein
MTREEEQRRRRKKLLHLRASFGGVAGFGYPIGMIPGVQSPNDAPPCNPDQFGGGGAAPAPAEGSGAGDGGDSASTGAGSGGGAP